MSSIDKAALDRYLTNEPDNGYQDWLEQVWDTIPEDKISGDEMEENEQFFIDGANQLALAGKNGFPSVKFTAEVFVSRFNHLKKNPHLKTWKEVQDFANSR